jgi:hypothetical protein
VTSLTWIDFAFGADSTGPMDRGGKKHGVRCRGTLYRQTEGADTPAMRAKPGAQDRLFPLMLLMPTKG